VSASAGDARIRAVATDPSDEQPLVDEMIEERERERPLAALLPSSISPGFLDVLEGFDDMVVAKNVAPDLSGGGSDLSSPATGSHASRRAT